MMQLVLVDEHVRLPGLNVTTKEVAPELSADGVHEIITCVGASNKVETPVGAAGTVGVGVGGSQVDAGTTFDVGEVPTALVATTTAL
jgi:hypothetical protein